MIFQGDINGEVGRLTDAFNEMVLELENRNQKLLASEERYRIVSDFAADFSFWLRPDYSFEYVSPACKTVTGYSSEELYANPQLIFDMIHPLDREMLMQLKNGSDSNCTRDEFEHRIITKDGATRWVRHTCRQISENNLFMGTRGSLSDITEKKQLADQVTHLVLHDMLTGLPNRSLFTDRLAVALAHEVRQKGGLLPIIFFGLDRFKVINETLGHESGDHLLVMVTKQIRKLLHQDDTLCRFSGDVFAFILSGRESKHEAVTMAYRILAAVSAPYLLGAQQVSITGSIGIVIAPQDGTDPDTLLKNAETAMYEAKRNGKNCFRFYSSDMNAQAAEILKLDSCMPQSLASGDFFLQFQPQLDLKNSRVVAVEALCRWRHPEMGMIPPNRFIPLAEESGFIIKLGEWILRTACSQSVSWRQHGIPPLRVAVNISAKQFSQPDFIDLVSSALSDSGLPADLLELELTESLLVSNEIQTLQKLQALKSMGIHLAIDDFGTGYSSFSYLKHFPLNRLKIDQSFVRDIITDPDDAAITEAIIVMAHVLKLKVIAEGVETVEQLAFLEDHGCDEIQGYYLSKPLSERDLISFVGAYGVEKEGQQ
jgi:diguanylate cyclase (GGDEF)-like protein/PAS domain S-box-containing protein